MRTERLKIGFIGLGDMGGRIARRIFRLAVKIFRGALSPIHGASDLAFRIASGVSYGLLYLPANLPRSARRSMLRLR